MHIMIDLETMGQGARCPILSIGAVAFDGLNDLPPIEGMQTAELTFEINVDLASQVGREYDGRTVYWWLNQSQEARDRVQRKPLVSITDALMDFRMWVQQFQPMSGKSSFWSNGASFDLPILADAFNQYGVPNPIIYWKGLCHRTVMSLAFEKKPPVIPELELMAHSAVHDAYKQAVLMTMAFKKMSAAGLFVA